MGSCAAHSRNLPLMSLDPKGRRPLRIPDKKKGGAVCGSVCLSVFLAKYVVVSRNSAVRRRRRWSRRSRCLFSIQCLPGRPSTDRPTDRASERQPLIRRRRDRRRRYSILRAARAGGPSRLYRANEVGRTTFLVFKEEERRQPVRCTSLSLSLSFFYPYL